MIARQRGRFAVRHLLWTGLLIGLGAVAGWYAWHSSRQAEDPRRGPRPQPVSVAKAQQRDVPVRLQALGTINAGNLVTVRAKVEGEVRAIRFKDGQLVKAGELLAELDDRSHVIAVSQASGQLAKDQALLANSRQDLARFQDLLRKDGISRQQVDTQQALVQQLQGTVQTSQAALDHARLQLSHTRVTSPIAGRVGLKQVDVGHVLRPSDANGLVTVAQVKPVNVVFAIPDQHVVAVQQKLREGQRLTVEAWDREQRNKLAEGLVSTIDNAIDTATGTVRLKAQFANEAEQLYPNQAVLVRLQIDTERQAVVVPTLAVQRGNQGTYVYVLQADQKVKQLSVQAGASDSGQVSLRGELKAGDQVVIEGAERLRDGALVQVIVSQDPTASAPEHPKRGGKGRPQ